MNFALYRLPYAETYTEVRSERDPIRISSCEEIGTEAGFLVAPFDCKNRRTPIILIRPDVVECKSVGKQKVSDKCETTETGKMSDSYASDFLKFHDAIVRGEFKKLVLSRSKEIPFNRTDYTSIFLEACQRYPRLMVMLVSTSLTGTWIVATPEILLTGDGTWWKTMALAGTMPYREGVTEWSKKNQQEQHFVETYIENRLSLFSGDILKDGPFTQRAGNLVHLCTEFRFHLAEGKSIGDILASLHPTPAVCGITKEEASQFIEDNETTERLYYTGFMGPVGIGDATHIYVSLRCAKLSSGTATLYAGGGIMPESDALSEWEETEHKMKTIGDVLE